MTEKPTYEELEARLRNLEEAEYIREQASSEKRKKEKRGHAQP